MIYTRLSVISLCFTSITFLMAKQCEYGFIMASLKNISILGCSFLSKMGYFTCCQEFIKRLNNLLEKLFYF